MSLEDVELPKQYRNGRVLFEQNLDAWRLATQEGFANSNLNLQQLARDLFQTGYDFDNDGIANKSLSLEDRINLLAAGGAPISGTSSSTWSYNTSGNTATLSASLLSSPRTFNVPDLSGTFLLTDGAQGIGNLALTQQVYATGSPNILRLNGGAHTTLTASAEASDVFFNFARTVQFATGAITDQRAFKILAPTYGFVGASVITNAATLYIDGPPVAGTNATITNPYALWVDSGLVRFDAGGTLAGTFTGGTHASATLSSPTMSGTIAGSPTVNGTWTSGNWTLAGTIAGTPTFSGAVTFTTAPIMPLLDPPTSNTQATAQSHCKAYAQSSGTPNLQEDYNITSVAKNATGDFTITTDRDAAGSQDWVVVVSADTTSSRFANGQVSATGVRVRLFDDAAVAVDTSFHAIFFGTLL